jgi:putative SOS response-associated peptidase YedK
MCGRFALHSPAGIISDEFGLEHTPECEARFNVAPGQQLLVVLSGTAAPLTDLFRWGLVPFWAKDPAIGQRMINARAETVAEKPSFRQAFQRRRCLIPADGFYEWQVANENIEGGKQPWYIHGREPGLLGFAGLWDTWEGGADGVLHTCTIITTSANEFMRPLHARMPVIVSPATYQNWLAPDTSKQELSELLASTPVAELTADRVSRKVNNPVHDEPGLIEPHSA